MEEYRSRGAKPHSFGVNGYREHFSTAERSSFFLYLNRSRGAQTEPLNTLLDILHDSVRKRGAFIHSFICDDRSIIEAITLPCYLRVVFCFLFKISWYKIARTSKKRGQFPSFHRVLNRFLNTPSPVYYTYQPRIA